MSDTSVRAGIKDGTYPVSGCNCNNCTRARGIIEEDKQALAGVLPLGSKPGDIVFVDEANPKDVLGAAKPSMGLIPVGAMEAVARVMELGAKKYGPYNWRSKKVKLMVYANAALRHLFKWIGGESIDEESGQSHLAHAAACLFIMLDADKTGNSIDDREWPHN